MKCPSQLDSAQLGKFQLKLINNISHHQLLFQVFLSTFMGSYSLYTSVALWVYPLNDFVGDIPCYMFIYARNIGFEIIQVHSFFVALFRYMCLFHVNLLLTFSLSSNVSIYLTRSSITHSSFWILNTLHYQLQWKMG